MLKNNYERSLLVIDDYRLVLNTMENFFKLEHITCYCAGDPEQALAILAEKKIKVILTDYKMPGMNGLEFLKKASAVHQDLIKIVMTGSVDIDKVTAALEAGEIWQFLIKPFDFYSFSALIIHAFEYLEMRQEKHDLFALNGQYLDLFNALDSLAIVLDSESRIWALNKKAEQTFGKKTEDLINCSLTGCGILFNWNYILDKLDSAKKQNKVMRLDDMEYTAENRKIRLGIKICPLFNSENNYFGALIIGIDIAEKENNAR